MVKLAKLLGVEAPSIKNGRVEYDDGDIGANLLANQELSTFELSTIIKINTKSYSHKQKKKEKEHQGDDDNDS